MKKMDWDKFLLPFKDEHELHELTPIMTNLIHKEEAYKVIAYAWRFTKFLEKVITKKYMVML